MTLLRVSGGVTGCIIIALAGTPQVAKFALGEIGFYEGMFWTLIGIIIILGSELIEMNLEKKQRELKKLR